MKTIHLKFVPTPSMTSHPHEVPSGSALVFQPWTQALQLLASRSVWIKARHHRKRKRHMLSLFYMGLNGFPLMLACVNVRFPSAPARQRRHAWPRAHITSGDRMGTHTYAHSGGTREADACQGWWGGHNGRMWCIVSANGATGRGLPTANVMGPIHVTRTMIDGCQSWN